MFTSSLLRILPAVFSSLVLAATVAVARPPAIQDNGAFFSTQAKSEAARNILELERSVKKDLAIESFSEIPADIKTGVNLGDKAAMSRLFNQWALKQAKAQGVNGVYILLVKTPAHLQVEVGNDTQKRAFTLQDRDVLVSRMLAKLRAKQNDEALMEGVNFVSATMRSHAAAGTHTGTVPPRVASGTSHSSFGWLIPALIIGVVVWVLFGVVRALFGRGSAMSPMSGGGGGGGGFLSSLIGGMFGAAAGMWMYNQFFSDHGSSAMAAEREDLESGDRGFTGKDDDYTGSGGDFGDSSGGDSGGGDSGGGDF